MHMQRYQGIHRHFGAVQKRLMGVACGVHGREMATELGLL